MKLLVVSHKPCWRSAAAPSGFASDGGFPIQMRALSERFDETRLVVPCAPAASRQGEVPLHGRNLSVVPLTWLEGEGTSRKALFPLWLARNAPALARGLRWADAVHVPIPSDVGTAAMLAAYAARMPLFVRYCGNWFEQATLAERLWKRFMERSAGGKRVMLATGGSEEPPSRANRAIRWTFATSLTEQQLGACAIRRQAPPRGRLRLIIVGRQDREKGTGVLIDSLPLLAGDFPAVTLDVVGDGKDLAAFAERAAAAGVSGRVVFHGKVDHENVIRLLRRADVFCLPSSTEGFPKVVLEALACGVPAVTTRVSVLPQLLGAGCGVLVDEITPAAVAGAIRVCRADPERYRAMSAAAVATARQYSLERWRDGIGELLREAWGPTLSYV